MADRSVKFCPACGHGGPARIYPKKGGTRHTGTYRCDSCNHTWHQREAGAKEGGLDEKYTVTRDGEPLTAPSFVLLLTDPAARLAAEAYAHATRNQKLRRDLLSLLSLIRMSPDEFPGPGSEGLLNAGLKHRTLTNDGTTVIIIERGDS